MSAAYQHTAVPDVLLQSSRRLDWRFLLPDPVLRKTLYIGPRQSALKSSLKLACESLILLDSGIGEVPEAGTFDLVVIVEPSRERIRTAQRALKAGGILYLEAQRGLIRTLALRLPAGFGTTYQSVQTIKAFGFESVEVYWHCPDFENCRDIVPLSSAAIHFMFSRTRNEVWGRWMLRAGRVLLCLALLNRLVTCVSYNAIKRRA